MAKLSQGCLQARVRAVSVDLGVTDEYDLVALVLSLACGDLGQHE